MNEKRVSSKSILGLIQIIRNEKKKDRYTDVDQRQLASMKKKKRKSLLEYIKCYNGYVYAVASFKSMFRVV